MPRRWMYWLVATAAGACIALGAGQGVAAADTSSDAAGSTSRSAESDSSQPSRAPSTRSDDGGGDGEGGDDSDDSATDTDTSADPASDPATNPSPTTSDGVVTLQQPTAEDDRDPAEDDGQTVNDDDAMRPVEADSTTTDKRSAARAGEARVDDAPVAAALTAGEPAAPVEPETVAGATAVTGVQTGRAKLAIPVGPDGFTTRADWYFPTQADGSVAATGVIWLQHGFMGRKFFYSALARALSQQTNSIVVAPNLPSFPSLRCGGCWINGAPTQQAVASMFLDDEAALNLSATAAGYVGTLPEDFILTGHSAGGGLAAAAGGYYADDPGNGGNLRGVVMFDGFSFAGVVPNALQSLDDPYIPVYQIAAPPQLGNLFGATTKELVAARPDRFVGVTLAGGSHVDSLIGGNRIVDFFAQLVTRFSPPGNTAAVYTLAAGWINDLYQNLGPTDGDGIYGAPDQYIVMGDTAAVVLGPAPVVDLDSYLGTWYEVGSVKQFFSIGLVNTTAVYSLNPDGSIKVENSGNYFVNNGPESSIVGVALPVDPTNNRLNVRFFGPASADPPGNYWIVDLDPEYEWAVVSDSTGLSGFLLSRTRIVSDDLYQELLDRASVKGVKGRITPTRQPAAGPATVSA